MVDDNRADESCEVIEATRVEKVTERTSEAPLVVVGSPKTPPLIVSSKGQVETVLLEERSKRAAEDEDLVEAPVSKAARNAPTIASPIPKPRTKLGGKAVMASSSSGEDELGGKPEVGKGSSSQGEGWGVGEREGQLGAAIEAEVTETQLESNVVETDTEIASIALCPEEVMTSNTSKVLETDLEESVAVIPLEKTMEVPVSVDSTNSSAVGEVVEVVKAKAKPGRGKQAAKKQGEADVSTGSEDEDLGRNKRTRKKKDNGKEKKEIETTEVEKEKENEEMLPPSPKLPAKTRGRKRKVNDSSNLSNVSTASHDSSIEHLSVSQNISSREEELQTNQSKGQETKAEKKKRIAEEKRMKAEEEKKKTAEKEEELKKAEEEKQRVQLAEAKTRSTRTKTIQTLLQELEPPAPIKNVPSPGKAPSLSSSTLVETALRSTRTRQRHPTPSDQAAAVVEAPRSTRSKQVPLHSSTSALHSVPPSASPRVRELAAAVSCSSLPRSNSPNRAQPVSSSPVLARVQAFETAMRAQAGLKPVATTTSDPQPSRTTRTRQKQRSATVEVPLTTTVGEETDAAKAQAPPVHLKETLPMGDSENGSEDEIEPVFPAPQLSTGKKTPPSKPASERRSRTTTKKTPPTTAERRSSVGDRLKRVSLARGVSMAELMAEQEVVMTSPPRRGPTIR